MANDTYGKRSTKAQDPLARFWDKVQYVDECWIWTGRLDRDGYGLYVALGTSRAHRVAFLALRGPIPEGLVIDHLCRRRDCVNPEHMEPVTDRTNILRGVGVTAMNAAKTHCVRGHDFATHGAEQKNGRYCKTCDHDQYLANRPTHCPNGHDYAEHAFYNSSGHRRCKPCYDERAARMRAARAAKCQPRPCGECGAVFTPANERALSCSDECKKARLKRLRKKAA